MINFDTTQISDIEARLLAKSLLDGYNQFYKDPENVKAFEEWQRKRSRKTS